MAFVLIGKGVHALEHGRRRLVADGAVGRVADHLGELAHAGELAFRRRAVEHAAHHGRELRQAVAARHAFAAGLQRPLFEKRELLRDRAHAGRHGVDAALLAVKETADAGVVFRPRRNR